MSDRTVSDRTVSDRTVSDRTVSIRALVDKILGDRTNGGAVPSTGERTGYLYRARRRLPPDRPKAATALDRV